MSKIIFYVKIKSNNKYWNDFRIRNKTIFYYLTNRISLYTGKIVFKKL